MDEFDDNGWYEIWEVFGEDPKRSSYSNENEDEEVEDQFWYEEIPDEFQFTSAWSEETNEDGKQFTSHEEIELKDEHPVSDPIHNEFVGPKYNKECQSEIHDSDEASPEYDPAEQKFTGNANDEIDKHQDQDDTENDPIGQKFTGNANDEIIKHQDQDDTENDSIGQKFASDANDEIIKDQDQDDTENDLVGQKFTGDSNDGMMKDWNLDDVEYHAGNECNSSDKVQIDQNIATPAEVETHISITENEDENEDDTAEDQFWFEEISDEFQFISAWSEETNGVEKQFTSHEDIELRVDDPIHDQLVGSKYSKTCQSEKYEEYDSDEASPEYDPGGQNFKGDANDEIIKDQDQDYTENDQNIATPAEVDTHISITENVPADSCDLLHAERLKHIPYKILQCNKSADGERKTFLGVFLYKGLFAGNHFPGTWLKWKASSFKISFQTAILFAGFFSCISGMHGENISPQDTFAAIGSTIRFKCSWDLKKPVYWEWTPVNSKTGVFLYIGNGGLVDSADDGITIDIDKDQGRYDLVITGVLVKHAGTYNCIENSGLGKSISAELTVLDDWNCSMDMPPGGFMGENVVNIPEDSILASCSLHFSGNKDPAIRWGLSKNVSHKNATMTINSASTIVSVFSMRPLKDLDKSVIIADVEGSGESSLTEGVQSWRSEMLTVNYVHLVEGPQRVYLEGDKNVLCNPKCSFQIINAYHGAIYRHAGREYQIPLTFDDDSHVPEGESKWLIMLILSVVFFAGSLVLLLVFVICSRFKVGNAVCAKDGSIKTSDTQTSMESEGFLKV